MSTKKQTAVVSARISAELAGQLDALCKATERERSYHVERAINEYVKANLWHVQAVQEGLADVEAGRVKPLDAVKAEWEARAASRPQGGEE
jgi:predicted transcriptional regulator